MLTTHSTTSNNIRTTIVSLIGATALLLTGCSEEAVDEQTTPKETAEATATSTPETTTSEAPSEAPEEDNEDELAKEVVSSLKGGDVVTDADDAEAWGPGVVREELRENKKGMAQSIFADFETASPDLFTFEAKDKCIIVRVKDEEFTDRLTYIAVPGVGSTNFEVDPESDATTDVPQLAELACVKNENNIKPLTVEEHQAQLLEQIEAAETVSVGRKISGNELELTEHTQS